MKLDASTKVTRFGGECRGSVSEDPEPAAADPVATPLQGTVLDPTFERMQTTLTMHTRTWITIFVPEGPRDPRGGPPIEGTVNARTFYA